MGTSGAEGRPQGGVGKPAVAGGSSARRFFMTRGSRRGATLLLIGGLAVGASACGSSTDAGPGSGSTTTSASSTPQSSSTTSTSSTTIAASSSRYTATQASDHCFFTTSEASTIVGSPVQPGVVETLDTTTDTCVYKPASSSTTKYFLVISALPTNTAQYDPNACSDYQGQSTVEVVSTTGGCLLVETAGSNATGGLINMYVVNSSNCCLQVVTTTLPNDTFAGGSYGPPGMKERVVAAGQAMATMLSH